MTDLFDDDPDFNSFPAGGHTTAKAETNVSSPAKPPNHRKDWTLDQFQRMVNILAAHHATNDSPEIALIAAAKAVGRLPTAVLAQAADEYHLLRRPDDPRQKNDLSLIEWGNPYTFNKAVPNFLEKQKHRKKRGRPAKNAAQQPMLDAFLEEARPRQRRQWTTDERTKLRAMAHDFLQDDGKVAEFLAEAAHVLERSVEAVKGEAIQGKLLKMLADPCDPSGVKIPVWAIARPEPCAPVTHPAIKAFSLPPEIEKELGWIIADFMDGAPNDGKVYIDTTGTGGGKTRRIGLEIDRKIKTALADSAELKVVVMAPTHREVDAIRAYLDRVHGSTPGVAIMKLDASADMIDDRGPLCPYGTTLDGKEKSTWKALVKAGTAALGDYRNAIKNKAPDDLQIRLRQSLRGVCRNLMEERMDEMVPSCNQCAFLYPGGKVFHNPAPVAVAFMTSLKFDFGLAAMEIVKAGRKRKPHGFRYSWHQSDKFRVPEDVYFIIEEADNVRSFLTNHMLEAIAANDTTLDGIIEFATRSMLGNLHVMMESSAGPDGEIAWSSEAMMKAFHTNIREAGERLEASWDRFYALVNGVPRHYIQEGLELRLKQKKGDNMENIAAFFYETEFSNLLESSALYYTGVVIGKTLTLGLSKKRTAGSQRLDWFVEYMKQYCMEPLVREIRLMQFAANENEALVSELMTTLRNVFDVRDEKSKIVFDTIMARVMSLFTRQVGDDVTPEILDKFHNGFSCNGLKYFHDHKRFGIRTIDYSRTPDSCLRGLTQVPPAKPKNTAKGEESDMELDEGASGEDLDMEPDDEADLKPQKRNRVLLVSATLEVDAPHENYDLNWLERRGVEFARRERGALNGFQKAREEVRGTPAVSILAPVDPALKAGPANFLPELGAGPAADVCREFLHGYTREDGDGIQWIRENCENKDKLETYRLEVLPIVMGFLASLHTEPRSRYALAYSNSRKEVDLAKDCVMKFQQFVHQDTDRLALFPALRAQAKLERVVAEDFRTSRAADALTIPQIAKLVSKVDEFRQEVAEHLMRNDYPRVFMLFTTHKSAATGANFHLELSLGDLIRNNRLPTEFCRYMGRDERFHLYPGEDKLSVDASDILALREYRNVVTVTNYNYIAHHMLALNEPNFKSWMAYHRPAGMGMDGRDDQMQRKNQILWALQGSPYYANFQFKQFYQVFGRFERTLNMPEQANIWVNRVIANLLQAVDYDAIRDYPVHNTVRAVIDAAFLEQEAMLENQLWFTSTGSAKRLSDIIHECYFNPNPSLYKLWWNLSRELFAHHKVVAARHFEGSADCPRLQALVQKMDAIAADIELNDERMPKAISFYHRVPRTAFMFEPDKQRKTKPKEAFLTDKIEGYTYITWEDAKRNRYRYATRPLDIHRKREPFLTEHSACPTDDEAYYILDPEVVHDAANAAFDELLTMSIVEDRIYPMKLTIKPLPAEFHEYFDSWIPELPLCFDNKGWSLNSMSPEKIQEMVAGGLKDSAALAKAKGIDPAEVRVVYLMSAFWDTTSQFAHFFDADLKAVRLDERLLPENRWKIGILFWPFGVRRYQSPMGMDSYLIKLIAHLRDLKLAALPQWPTGGDEPEGVE